ncbi:MAG: D-alanyl-D-alanine carboxypeptidase family protein [Ruminococcus flavefaciens]|nr:D-alanyl-D-alanine carboxypeptidase family protein [Ruminococcus flavefaciens]MCM1230531.1 D-alanyl-D-alanine carboxypeptidase family protein [Ruminococcus flavefaciens]
MNQKSVKIKAFAAVLICAVSMSSCGKTVSSDDDVIIPENPAVSDTPQTDVSTIPETTAETTDNSADLLIPSASGVTLSYNEAEVIAGQTIKYPEVAETIPEVWTSSDENVATVDTIGNITGVGEGVCIIKVASEADSGVFAEVKVTVSKAEGIQQIDGITYVNGILIANKTYELPPDYNPGGLTDATYSAFEQLSSAAADDGLDIYLSSGFRSYEYQNEIYTNYVAVYGQETADTFSARPGHSEHQSGLAIDVNTIDDSFAGTPEAIWLEEHCIEYGFIIRYPKGKDGITGYKYEPWHIRYVGKDVAQEIHDASVACGDPTLTLEEYLNITSVYQ